MSSMADLARPIPTSGPGACGKEILERFEADPGCFAIAVVDSDRKPIGLVERGDFALKLAGPYGHSLYSRRPVTTFMDPRPQIVDADVAIDAFTRSNLAENPASLLRSYVVTRNGAYLGIGSALSLLEAQNAAVSTHAAAAQSALRAKSEFLAVMSHEIRTPLNGVLAIAEVMERRLEQAALRPYVSTILESGRTLLRLLNDALDLSRAEMGRFDLEPEPFRVAGLIEDVEALWRPRASEAGLELFAETGGQADAWAIGDAIRLKQVFNNLVGNAIKFTRGGSVTCRIDITATSAGLGLIGTVRDTGPGIAQEDLPHIFTPFGQTPSGRASGGAGLGLSICRQIIEKMDGRILVSSEPGRGSEFRFEVVLPEAAPAERPAGTDPAFASASAPTLSARVLVVDDNAINRLVAETVCRAFGCVTENVDSGAMAIASAASGSFDLILMDIKMPGMDGLEATRRIRRLAGPLGRTPVIAVTANANPVETRRYFDEGVNAVVEKPINPGALAEAMMRALGGRRRVTTAPSRRRA